MMPKLHELLAAEKTPNGAWNQLYEDTLKKFKNPAHFFDGHSKTLKMIEDSPSNAAIEAQAREEKPVTTNVLETLEYALDIYGRAEDLQYQKNATNRTATGTVLWQGAELFPYPLPVDELLGLEARLGKIRALYAEIPTVDATKHWVKNPSLGSQTYELEFPEQTTKTEKTMVPVIMAPATDKHPAQVQAVSKDSVVGTFTLVRRSGAVTAQQKADAIKLVDELLIAIKQARMRANETEVQTGKVSDKLIELLLQPLK